QVYDADNRLIFQVDALGAVIATTYDTAGRVTAKRAYANPIPGRALASFGTAAGITAAQVTGNVATSAADLVTNYSYDAASRLKTTVSNPGGLALTTPNTYDKDGNLVIVQDPAGALTRYVYDADNRLIFQVDALGDVMATTYDAENH